MGENRTYNSIINSLFGIVASFVSVAMNFFVRMILVRQLGAEMNGLHNLFQSIASVMTIMELGISSAMVIHLYAPVAEKNREQIKGIMSFYKKTYCSIAIIYAAVSIIISFFLLDKIVTTEINIVYVRVYFLVFGMSFVINYLTYYKRSILYAEQKNRISTAVTALCEIFFRSLQILTLIVTKNYLVFLIIWILEKLTGNTICSLYVNKKHPYLVKNHAKISNIKKQEIVNTVKPLVVSQTANTVTQSAKSILISILLGNVSIVGYFGNYQLVANMVQMVYTQFGGAFTSSFGNLAVTKDNDRMKRAFMNSSFILNWVAAILCSGFIVCIKPFIIMTFGLEYVLDMVSVLSLLVSLIFYLINIPVISIQNSMGLHRLDAKYMVLQAILSIILGYVGGVFGGMAGIFLGLTIPTVLFTTLRKGIVITKSAFEMSIKEYCGFVGYETAKVFFTVIVSIVVCQYIRFESVGLTFVVNGIIACIIGIFVPALLSLKSPQLKYAIKLFRKILRFD